MPTDPATLRQRIARFLADAAADDFDRLALAAFAFQLERVEPYRAWCRRRGVTVEGVESWRQVPWVPTAAFRSLELAAEPAVETFRSSGTTGGAESRSVHHQPYPELYRAAIDASFPRFCLPFAGRPPVLSLIPARATLPDSSLSFMAEHVLERYGGEGSLTAFGARGVDFPSLRSWCSARQRDRRPALVLSTALALAQALDRLERLDLRFRLPAGTVVFETGGFKGRASEVTRADLLARLGERLGVPAGQVVREYGMTELSSQCYTSTLLGQALSGRDPDLFVAPHWVRVRVLEPVTLAEAPAGEPGLIAVLDLANLGSAVHVLTEDLGVAEGEGFRLVGRAEGAQLRGCSLAAEELGHRPR